MSVEQARAFIAKMKSDEAFRNRITAIEDVAERFKLIEDAGFDCSEAEIKEVSGELSDDELDGWAGGFNVSCSIKCDDNRHSMKMYGYAKGTSTYAQCTG